MAMVGKFVTHDNDVDADSKVVQIFHTRLYYVPLLTESFVKVGLRSCKPWIDDDIEPVVLCIGCR
jgi:hypothetical protein